MAILLLDTLNSGENIYSCLSVDIASLGATQVRGAVAYVTDSPNLIMVYDNDSWQQNPLSKESLSDSALSVLSRCVAPLLEHRFMVQMVNKTGAVSVKGDVVMPSDSTDNAVALIVQNEPDPIGIIYESGVADGDLVWVVCGGKAQVNFIGNATRGQLVRGFLTGDAGFITGKALAESIPTSPFATDKHFYEIGHVIESRTGAGLAWCMVHFN